MRPRFALLFACLLLPGALVFAQPSCFQRLGAIGLICRHFEPELALEIRSQAPQDAGATLLRVTQSQVAAAGRGNLVLSSQDGRVAVRFQADGQVRVSMGPTDEGKVHHVLFEGHLGGAVIGTYDTYESMIAPALPEAEETSGEPGAAAGRRPAIARQPAREDGSVIHVVGPGHTLLAIARVYDVDLRQLMADNGLTDSLLLVGQELLIPATPEEPPQEEAELPDRCSFYRPVTYVARPGDSLYRIAIAFDVEFESLLVRNQFPAGGRLLHVGQELVIPGVTRPEARGREVPAECLDDSPLLHLVQEGHTLAAVARAYGVEPQTIVELNDLTGGRLQPGRTLVIRDGPAPQATPEEAQADG